MVVRPVATQSPSLNRAWTKRYELRPISSTARADLDGAGPVEFAEEVDLEPRHDRSGAGHLQAVLLVVDQADPAGFEIGREHRVIDVALMVEIAEADDVADADWKSSSWGIGLAGGKVGSGGSL